MECLKQEEEDEDSVPPPPVKDSQPSPPVSHPLSLLESIHKDILLSIFKSLHYESTYVIPTLSKTLHYRIVLEENAAFWREYYTSLIGNRAGASFANSFKLGVRLAYVAEKQFNGEIVGGNCSGGSLRRLVGCEMDILLNRLLEGTIEERMEMLRSRHHLDRALQTAINLDNPYLVEVLLKFRARTDVKLDGKTAKQIALKKGNAFIIVLVCPEAALDDPNIFIAAIKNRKVPTVLNLIKMKVNINFAGSGGDTPLHVATRMQMHDLVKVLLQEPTLESINTLNRCQYTPLHLSIKEKDLPLAQLLLEHAADIALVPPNGMGALAIAAQFSTAKIFEWVLCLIKPDSLAAIRTKKNRSLLHLVALNQDPTAVDIFDSIKDHFTPNEYDHEATPLQHAIKQWNPPMATALVAFGEDPSLALPIAFQIHNSKAFQFLLFSGAVLTDSILIDVWSQRWMDGIISSMTIPVDVNLSVILPSGETLAHLCCFLLSCRSHFQSYLFRILPHIPINHRDNLGWTILDRAIFQAAPTSVVEKLLDANAQVNHLSPQDVFHRAHYYDLLLSKKLVSLPPNHFFAVQQDYPDSLDVIYEVLHRHGADIHWRNEEGELYIYHFFKFHRYSSFMRRMADKHGWVRPRESEYY